MDGQNCPRPRCDLALYLLGIQVHGHRIHVGKHRGGTGVYDAVDGCAEGEGSSKNFVARFEARRQQTQLHSRGARTDGSGIWHLLVFLKVLFEASHLRPGPEPATFEAGDDFLYLGILDSGGAKDQEIVFATDRRVSHCNPTGNIGLQRNHWRCAYCFSIHSR